MDYPIRVLILDTVMDRGGAEAMTMNYLRHLDRNKIQFDFLVHRSYKAAYEDEIESLGGNIYRICPPYPQNFFRYRKAFRALLAAHPEYRIIHCNMMEHGLFAYIEANRQRIPIIICHAHTAPNKMDYSIKGLILWFYRLATKKYITHKFACGVKAAEWVFGKNNVDDVIYMKNAIDAGMYRYNPEVEITVREEFGITDKFVVGHVGRFFKPKNHPFIIDIFQKLVKKNPNAVLLLVGGGELDDAIMNQTKDRVRSLSLEDKVIFTGVREDVYRIIQSFDIFILPSLNEGFPVVLVEAQAAGLKCIISDRVSKECDITGNAIFLTIDDSADLWVEEILNCDHTKRDNYSKIVAAGYDIKENAQWLENFYINELIEKAEQ